MFELCALSVGDKATGSGVYDEISVSVNAMNKDVLKWSSSYSQYK